MNTQAHARNAYADARSVALSGRDIEYRAFARATSALSDLPTGDPTSFPKLVEAVQFNLDLWGVIARDVSQDGNLLPDTLRAGLLSLYEFSKEHSRKVLRGEASVDALVDINRSVMRGLRSDLAQG